MFRERYAEVLRQRYVPGAAKQPTVTLAVVGRNMGITGGRVGQIEAIALREIAYLLRHVPLAEPVPKDHWILRDPRLRQWALEFGWILPCVGRGWYDGPEGRAELEANLARLAAINPNPTTPPPPSWLASLGLPARVHNALWRWGIREPADLLNLSKGEVSAIRNFGRGSFLALCRGLEQQGIAVPRAWIEQPHGGGDGECNGVPRH